MKTALAYLLVVICLFPAIMAADSTTYNVPEQFSTIQAAVDAASAGDTIRVGYGSWCGAVIGKPLNLVGDGQPSITNQGCSGLNAWAGFWLLPTASGSTIRNFVFVGTSAAESYGIFGNAADNVIVEQNTFNGVVFAVHNMNGSGWQVSHNKISGAFEGIVFMRNCRLNTRALDNSAMFNSISQGLVDGNGIWLFGQDGAVIKNNTIEIPSSPDPPAPLLNSWGIVATDYFSTAAGCDLTSINSLIVNNDGRNAGTAVLVPLDHNGGTGNSVGNQLRGNFGVNAINVNFQFDDPTSTVKNRSKVLQCDGEGNCSW